MFLKRPPLRCEAQVLEYIFFAQLNSKIIILYILIVALQRIKYVRIGKLIKGKRSFIKKCIFERNTLGIRKESKKLKKERKKEREKY